MRNVDKKIKHTSLCKYANNITDNCLSLQSVRWLILQLFLQLDELDVTFGRCRAKFKTFEGLGCRHRWGDKIRCCIKKLRANATKVTPKIIPRCCFDSDILGLRNKLLLLIMWIKFSLSPSFLRVVSHWKRVNLRVQPENVALKVFFTDVNNNFSFEIFSSEYFFSYVGREIKLNRARKLCNFRRNRWVTAR